MYHLYSNLPVLQNILIKYLADTQVCVYVIHETQIPMIVCLWLVLNSPQGVLQSGSSVCGEYPIQRALLVLNINTPNFLQFILK